jgi:hypothetical protein
MEMVCAVNPLTGEYECGTGGWAGPRPGDPDMTNLLLKATAAFGGIDVEWTFPNINPSAVAYTTIYRSLLPDPDTAVVLKQAQGNFYYDAIESTPETRVRYFYWIRVHSIYGTPGDLIGPASAVAKSRIEQTIEELTGKIDAGVLAQSLKKEIDRIELNALGITQEMVDRARDDAALGVRINQVGAELGTAKALLQEEVLARTSANEAFVSTVNTLYTTVNGNIAAVQTQVSALSTDVSALAQQVTKLESQVGNDLAQVLQQMRTEIAVVDGKVVAIGALWTAQVNVNGLIGGFGVYNDGRIVEAGFDVDRFWIGRTGANKRKPFIVENNLVLIDEAAINKLTFSKLRDESGSFIVENGKIKAQYLQVGTLIVNKAQSDNYSPGVSGWYLGPDGTIEINGVGGQGRMIITPTLIRVLDSGGIMRVRMGIW